MGLTPGVCTPGGVAPTLDIGEDKQEEEEPNTDMNGDWPPEHWTVCDEEMERLESSTGPTSNIPLAQWNVCKE